MSARFTVVHVFRSSFESAARATLCCAVAACLGACAASGAELRPEPGYRCPGSDALLKGRISGEMAGPAELSLALRRDRVQVVLSLLQPNGELFAALSGLGTCRDGLLRVHFDRGYRPSAWKTRFRGDFVAMLGNRANPRRAFGAWSAEVIGKVTMLGVFASRR